MALYSLNLDSEWNRYQKNKVPEDVVKTVKRFIRHLNLTDIGEKRQYFYAVRLRKVYEIMQESFLNPTKDDIMELMDTLKHRDYEENTVEDYKTTIKRFYKWLLNDDEGFPPEVAWIKRKSRIGRTKKPEDLITENEINSLIDNCTNSRDRALFSLLYDSGCRIGEILTLRIKDLIFDNYGGIVKVTGKTGFRNVRIFGNSTIYLRNWLDSHPDQNNPDSWLFCGYAYKTTIKKQMTYDDVHSALRKALKRAGITKRIHPHLFRHTRASIIAQKSVPTSIFESEMGWIPGSRQVRTYVHLTGKQVDDRFLEAMGIKKKEENHEEIRPKICPRCGESNVSTSSKCRKCWLPLNEKGLEEQQAIEIRKIVDLISSVKNDKKAFTAVIEYIMNSPQQQEIITRYGISLENEENKES